MGHPVRIGRLSGTVAPPSGDFTLSGSRCRSGMQMSRAPVGLAVDYQDQAKRDASLQLEKAGVRMAVLLNRALGS